MLSSVISTIGQYLPSTLYLMIALKMFIGIYIIGIQLYSLDLTSLKNLSIELVVTSLSSIKRLKNDITPFQDLITFELDEELEDSLSDSDEFSDEFSDESL